MAGGRPTDYTEELADNICSLIAGGSNLNKICSDDDMPNRSTVYEWFRKHESFSTNYVRAREDRADYRFDRVDEVIKDLRADVIDASQARVELDAIKWQTGKEKPKQYGDKLDVEHGGNITVEIVDGLGKSDEGE